MQYRLNEKRVINIPDSEIKRSMEKLDLTEEEAIQMYLEDEGYEVNEEQEELERKAKENRITATIHQAKADKPKTQRKVERKADTTKESIIANISQFLSETDGICEVNVVNVGKLITFKLGNDTFKLDLIRQRPPKDKK